MTLPDATLVAFCYDERPTLPLMRSLIRDARRWPNLAIWDKSRDALITRMRSDAAEKFLEQGSGDVLIMVDHDIGWEAGDLEHLTRVCLDLNGVVGGVFPKRGFGLGVPIRFGQYGEYTIPDDRVVECWAVATGFIAIHRDVLAAIARDLPMTIHGYRKFFDTREFVHPDGRVEDLSEDFDFCEKARAAGFKVWADLRPQLTHMGSHHYRVQDSVHLLPDRDASTVLHEVDVNVPCRVQGFDSAFDLWVDRDDKVVSGRLIAGKPWEPEVMGALARIIRPTDTVVEVGAHIGYQTVQIAKLAARVVVAEPLPHLVEILRKNVVLHELDNVDVWPMAIVGEEDKRRTARILRDWGNPGASFLLPEDEVAGIEVVAARLADLAERIDVLKLDTEGAEYLILNGPRARAALAHCRAIVFEYCEAQLERVSGVTGDQLLDLIEDMGFGTGILDRAELPKGWLYCNILAERREYYEGAQAP